MNKILIVIVVALSGLCAWQKFERDAHGGVVLDTIDGGVAVGPYLWSGEGSSHYIAEGSTDLARILVSAPVYLVELRGDHYFTAMKEGVFHDKKTGAFLGNRIFITCTRESMQIQVRKDGDKGIGTAVDVADADLQNNTWNIFDMPNGPMIPSPATPTAATNPSQ